MKNKKKGFTLVELLAVIVVLAIIVMTSSVGIVSVINNSKKTTSSEMRNNLKEAALSYSFSNMYLEKCSLSFSKEMEENNPIHLDDAENISCIKKVTVETLKNKGFFEDNREYCKNSDEVVIYRYMDDLGNSEYKAYVSDTVCTD